MFQVGNKTTQKSYGLGSKFKKDSSAVPNLVPSLLIINLYQFYICVFSGNLERVGFCCCSGYRTSINTLMFFITKRKV